MYGSPPPGKDLNRPFHHHHHQQQQQMSSGLLRYRSAPSALFGEGCEDFLPVRPSSPDTDTMFARFLLPDLREEIRDKPTPSPPASGPQFPPPQLLPMAAAVSAAEENAVVTTAAFSSAAAAATQMLYQQQQQFASNLATSMAMEAEQIKNGSNLIRHSSSPAGLFSHLNVYNGYGVMRGVGGFRNGNEGGGGGGGGTRLKSQLSFSSRQSSSSAAAMMSEEMENEESMGGYPIASWEESPLLSENNFRAGGLKRARENQSEIQNGEVRNGLCHQFSLPKTSSEMSAFEKFLQFQDSVPCKIRAKRGCATHPRSIAERVRRTRISERMRKLQDLVPNMDKQTNTADMLDLAVHYIKDLQKQVKTLNDGRASCTCSSSKKKPYQNSTS